MCRSPTEPWFLQGIGGKHHFPFDLPGFAQVFPTFPHKLHRHCIRWYWMNFWKWYLGCGCTAHIFVAPILGKLPSRCGCHSCFDHLRQHSRRAILQGTCCLAVIWELSDGSEDDGNWWGVVGRWLKDGWQMVGSHGRACYRVWKRLPSDATGSIGLF